MSDEEIQALVHDDTLRAEIGRWRQHLRRADAADDVVEVRRALSHIDRLNARLGSR